MPITTHYITVSSCSSRSKEEQRRRPFLPIMTSCVDYEVDYIH